MTLKQKMVWFILAATFFGGLLAGGNADRALVAMPGWAKLGPLAWAAFSRGADLGNGLWWHPLEAFAGFGFSLAAAIQYYKACEKAYDLWLPISLAWIFALAGLGLTIQAAPAMLSLPRLGNDAAALRKAFEGFWFWGNWRGLCQTLAFACNLWSLAVLALEE